MKTLMVYGANGYTGKLIVQELQRRGQSPLLAGRNATAIAELGSHYNMPTRVFDLQDPTAVQAGLEGVGTVLHAAGPYVHTAEPMRSACLQLGINYLDITGEANVLQDTLSGHEAAVAKGIVLMGGTGFDVVPSDCLASYLAAKVPDAQSLELAFDIGTSPSAGTALSSLEAMMKGQVAYRRMNGRLVPRPFGHDTIWLRMPKGKQRHFAAIVWGDLVTAFHSTRIPNIVVYSGVPPLLTHLAQVGLPILKGLLSRPRIRKWAQGLIASRVAGPSEQDRQTRHAQLWGRAIGPRGSAQAWLQTPEAYHLTALTSVDLALRIHAGELKPGAWTPAQAMGADYILSFPGTQRWDALPEQ